MIETGRLYTRVVTMNQSWRTPPQPARPFLLWREVITLSEVGQSFAGKTMCAPLDECTDDEKAIGAKLIEMHGLHPYEPTPEEDEDSKQFLADLSKVPFGTGGKA
jgi:hypothetical protein